MAKVERMGDIMHELEKVITKMIDQHDMQKGEVLSLVNGYIDVHFPSSKEVYSETGDSPIFYYGHRKGIK